MGEKAEAPGLRARTRAATRAEIAAIAFDLFARRGFEKTTAAEAAEAAGISRASFFRYFASKEEAVFAAQEATGAELAAAIAERPASEDPWTVLNRAFDEVISSQARRDPESLLARVRLARETPALRAHQLERQTQWREMLAAALAPRLGVEAHDMQVEAMVAAALSALDTAVSHWGHTGGGANLTRLVDEAFEAIRGIPGKNPS